MAPPVINPYFELCMLITQLRKHEREGVEEGQTFKQYTDRRKALQLLVDNHLTLAKMRRHNANTI